MGALSCNLRLSSAAGIWFPGSWCGCRWILCGLVTSKPGARVSLSQVGAEEGGTMRPFPRGSRAEPAAGKQSAPALGPRGLAGTERGCWGQWCQALAGLAGGWASQVPGNQSRLDTRGVLWNIFRARLCLLHLGAGGSGEMVGREEGRGLVGARDTGTDHLLASCFPTAAWVLQEVRSGLAPSLPVRGQRCSA